MVRNHLHKENHQSSQEEPMSMQHLWLFPREFPFKEKVLDFKILKDNPQSCMSIKITNKSNLRIKLIIVSKMADSKEDSD